MSESLGRILVVEDDEFVASSLERFLVRERYDVVLAQDGRQAIVEMERDPTIQLVITDLEMPHAGGEEVLKAGLRRALPVVVLTGKSSVETAVHMMKLGAATFLSKPFTGQLVRDILRQTFGRAEHMKGRVVGAAPAFKKVVDVIASVAETDATVLILGESGTGKEVVAQSIHAASRRSQGPFVAVNCGAIPEALLESELFGHAKGAFTGATQARPGRFRMASGGTLFLDEIGDMPLSFQVKLLRVLQEQRYDVLGESESRTCDVRVIAATHRDLEKRIQEGAFREDLFYRLNVIDIHLPALRERKEDIPLLVEHFIAAANARHARNVDGVDPQAMELLCAYGWPGNVRELANTIERLVVLKRGGSIGFRDLPASITKTGAAPVAATGSVQALPVAGIDLVRAVADFESSLITSALERTGGNRTAAAELLGLNRTTLVEKIKRSNSG